MGTTEIVNGAPGEVPGKSWHEMDEATMENLKDTASRSKKKRARREYNEKHRGVSEPRFLPFPEAHAYA